MAVQIETLEAQLASGNAPFLNNSPVQTAADVAAALQVGALPHAVVSSYPLVVRWHARVVCRLSQVPLLHAFQDADSRDKARAPLWAVLETAFPTANGTGSDAPALAALITDRSFSESPDDVLRDLVQNQQLLHASSAARSCIVCSKPVSGVAPASSHPLHFTPNSAFCTTCTGAVAADEARLLELYDALLEHRHAGLRIQHGEWLFRVLAAPMLHALLGTVDLLQLCRDNRAAGEHAIRLVVALRKALRHHSHPAGPAGHIDNPPAIFLYLLPDAPVTRADVSATALNVELRSCRTPQLVMVPPDTRSVIRETVLQTTQVLLHSQAGHFHAVLPLSPSASLASLVHDSLSADVTAVLRALHQPAITPASRSFVALPSYLRPLVFPHVLESAALARVGTASADHHGHGAKKSSTDPLPHKYTERYVATAPPPCAQETHALQKSALWSIHPDPYVNVAVIGL
eukprot:TRINITY_DN189_c2_g1_i1.p1 TRINITY_DN189_c2_g1~~TRINITY_DN189_c2_g1_i1.p1  ORF type:complete len:461 (+),score=80.48 TRINITY_DN189_c2_g1_i1:12-1394(+)